MYSEGGGGGTGYCRVRDRAIGESAQDVGLRERASEKEIIFLNHKVQRIECEIHGMGRFGKAPHSQRA